MVAQNAPKKEKGYMQLKEGFLHHDMLNTVKRVTFIVPFWWLSYLMSC